MYDIHLPLTTGHYCYYYYYYYYYYHYYFQVRFLFNQNFWELLGRDCLQAGCHSYCPVRK